MRRRLVVVFLVPLVAILLSLGGATAWSATRSIQQGSTPSSSATWGTS